MKQTPIPAVLQEVLDAQENLKCARVAFDYATEAYIEIAIEQLEVAEKMLNIALKKAKLEGFTNDIVRIDMYRAW